MSGHTTLCCIHFYSIAGDNHTNPKYLLKHCKIKHVLYKKTEAYTLLTAKTFLTQGLYPGMAKARAVKLRKILPRHTVNEDNNAVDGGYLLLAPIRR